MSAIENLLARLSKVRKVADGRYVAGCPAHDDKSPSLSIRETNDGVILIHDFGGCDSGAVLSAIGLNIRDLFPERLPKEHKSQRPNHWHARKEAFETIHKDSLLIALAGESLAAGIPLSIEDRNKLCDAAARVRYAVEVCR